MSGAEHLTLGGLFRRLRREFRNRGLATPELDARLLASAACNLSHEGFALHQERPVQAEEQALVDGYRRRRLDGEPVSRILGEREFWGLPFHLDTHVLDPRPDTETLVAAVLELGGDGSAPLSVLDLGTGTGCVLLSLLSELRQASGVGGDRDPRAIATARANAVRIGVDARASFFCGSWIDAVAGQFDFVVSNPPYIRSGDMAGLPVEVARHDPRLALDGGEDGLEAYRQIAARLDAVLSRDGWAVFEVGAGQAQDVIDIVEPCIASSGGGETRVWRDLAGIERCIGVKAGKPGEAARKRG